MQFSTKAEYGLRAMVALARAYPNQKSIAEISEEENISAKYLERLMGELRKSNLIKSQKGKSGGYTFIKKPAEVSAGEIIEIMEGPIISKCDGSHCKKSKVCASSFVWTKLAFQIKQTLFAIKLSELI